MAAADDDDRTVIRPPAARAPVTPPPATPVAPALATTQYVGPPQPAVVAQTLSAFADDMGNGLPIGTCLGEFELTRMVGEGGFGIVYEATDHSLQRRVALKEYMPSSLAARMGKNQVSVKSERHRETFQAGLKSFINEARLLASFDHPSLVKVYRFWEANGTAYMVMPFLEGVTLKDRLRELSSPPDEAWLHAVLTPVTEALCVIHAEQCYHRDIAPDNVMQLGVNSRWLVLDFGAARRVIGDMTQALTVILKPGYAPVEQYAEIPGMKQGPWTDVYALAAVVHFAIMGRTPPPSVGRLLNDTYVPLVEAAAGRYSAGFLAAVDRALIVRPEARTQTIEQFRRELGLGALPAPDSQPMRSPPPPRPAPPPIRVVAAGTDEPPAPAARANKALVGGIAGVAVLGAAAFGAYSLLAPSPRPPAPVAATEPAPAQVVATPAPAPAPAPVSAPATAPTTAPVATAPPPLAVPPPAAGPAPPSGLDPMREFDRVVQASDAGYGLRAGTDKPTVRIGRDEIGFHVQADRDGYLYVFATASDGALVQIVPNKFSSAVQLKKGQRYGFPTGDPAHLDASDPPGPGALLVVVSARQRDHRALEPKNEGPWRFFPTGNDAAAIVARNQGPQALLAGKAICPASGPCDDSYGAALVKFDVVK